MLKNIINESTDMKITNKKLAYELDVAIGNNSIGQFAKELRINDVKLIEDMLNCKLNFLPPRELLRRIADSSKGRVTYRKLYDICGYSEYDEEEDKRWMDIKPNRGDVFFADLGWNVDQEQNGIRTVVIISNNVGNSRGNIIMAAPTTTKVKRLMPTHIELTKEDGMREDSTILIEQARCISKRRLFYSGFPIKVTQLSEEKIFEVNTAIEKEFGLIDVMFNDERAMKLIEQIELLRYKVEVRKERDLIDLLNEKADEFEVLCAKYFKNPDVVWNSYKRINAQYA